MRFPLFLSGLWLILSVTASGQLTGQFYLEKSSFARSEPVILYYRLTNNGHEAITVVDRYNPEQPDCSGQSIKVSNDVPPAFEGCFNSGGLAQSKSLGAGESYSEQFLLNFNHDLSVPGDYWVQAKHSGMGPDTVGNEDTKLIFHIEETLVSPAELQPWINALHSTDPQKRNEAARTLASLAPPFLEETLLGFINEPGFRRYAPLAFHRLNTSHSLDKMAELMDGPITNEQLEAAHYLAETADQHWYPVLREAAKRNARISSFPADAAELGGEKALPMLSVLSQSPDREFTAGNAIMAMGSTGSSDAIPMLLEYLNSPDIHISDQASYALQVLTHHRVVQDEVNRNRRTEAADWLKWWERDGSTAHIYKASEYGAFIALQEGS